MIPDDLQEISPTTVAFNELAVPFSAHYQDYYFSLHDGLQESSYVFLQGNNLPENWQNKRQFVIAETGFGSGLNFLATWRAWKADPVRCRNLHFISVEKHPLSPQQIKRVVQKWPELQPLLAQLLAVYPMALAGFHHMVFEQGRVRLTLCFGDIKACLSQCVMRVDAWYLDGFAPARNEAMWSLDVFRLMAVLSHKNTTLATFTAAGQVRRALQGAGFSLGKRAGYAKKREMLIGYKDPAFQAESFLQPWYALPESITTNFSSSEHSVTILGAGVAGCQIAYALAQRGWHVTVLERHDCWAQEASGNPAGVVVPKMTAQSSWGERFYRQAFLHAIQQLKRLTQNTADLHWDSCGTLQLNHNERELKRWQALQKRGLPAELIQLLSREEASDVAGINLAYGASYFPQAAWLKPASLCRVLLQHPNIQVRLSANAWKIQAQAEGYGVMDIDRQLLSESTHIVIANGRDVSDFVDTYYLPLLAVAGQSSRVMATPYSKVLKTNLGHEGYMTPAIQGRHCLGANFDRGISEIQLDPAKDQQNYQQLKYCLPELAAQFNQVTGAHAAVRMATPDRFPYVGALPDIGFFQKEYATLHHGGRHQAFMNAKYQSGIFLLAGLGSRGLTTSAYCAEILASMMNNEPLAIQKTLYYQLHPARFLIKRLRQNHLLD